jgi:hypothetical protein
VPVDIKTILFRLSRYSISAHNSQPFQIQLQGQEVRVFARRDRFLPAADPHNKDLRMALGALFETLNIGLSSHNIQLEVQLLLIGKFVASSDKPVAIFSLKDQEMKPNPLALALPKRFSYRAVFPKKEEIADFENNFRVAQSEMAKAGLLPITDLQTREQIKNAFKEINLRFLNKPGYIEELYSWMRFSNQNPRWSLDGLNAESIALSPVETTGARFFMRPKVFRFMNKLGLAGMLVDESPKIMSAPFLVVIPAPAESSDFDKGRLFMRGWLELTRLRLFGAPLSLLTDETETLQYVSEITKLPPGMTIANVIRCGFLRNNYVRYLPARLTSQELEFK